MARVARLGARAAVVAPAGSKPARWAPAARRAAPRGRTTDAVDGTSLVYPWWPGAGVRKGEGIRVGASVGTAPRTSTALTPALQHVVDPTLAMTPRRVRALE